MALNTGTNPYDIEGLLGGAARVLYTDDLTAAIPSDISDIIDPESPYAAAGDWVDFGATKESATYSREIDSEGYEIQNTTGSVLEEITEVNRTLEVSVAEINPAHLAMIEVSSSGVGTIAAAAGTPAQKEVKFGSFNSIPRRRVAFVAQRNIGTGTVTESGATVVRGGFVCFVLFNVAVSADTTEVEFEKGELVEAPVTFTAFPDPTKTQGQEYGAWYFEDLGQTLT